MKVTTEKGQKWDIDLVGRRARQWDQKGETDGWEDYQECSIPRVGSPIHVTLEPGLVLTIDQVKELEPTASDQKFLEKLAESLKDLERGC